MQGKAEAGIPFPYGAYTSGKVIFETKELVIGYDEPLSRPLNIGMERGEKIALVGANGIGKDDALKKAFSVWWSRFLEV